VKHTDDTGNLRPLPDAYAGMIDALFAAIASQEDLEMKVHQATVKDLEAIERHGRQSRCLRCDERLVKHISYKSLINHYMQARLWYDSSQASILADRSQAYPHLTVDDPLPGLYDTHDWAQDAPLHVQEDFIGLNKLSKIQKRFRRDHVDDHPADTPLVPGGEPSSRICLLCPAGFSPLPMCAAKMELHLTSRHRKEPNLPVDSAIFDPHSSTLPHHPDPTF